ncbi:MAG: DegT/DnrJ/EryC1/StrS family aminotransferase [Planctomycetaceae bacterium]|nr:DegT/DnrJ/EryC1/StrS family aminotransferase [Planctomycetaceae bacterium]
MIPLVKTRIPPRHVLMPVLEEVLYSGYVAQGDTVEEFERRFEEFVEGGSSLSLNSGTAALHIALILAGVSDGDEVISTALTAEPTNVAIKMAGGRIRYADIDPKTMNISPDSIRNSLTSSTKAIMVVDYAGIPVDVDRIRQISEDSGIPVIHDAAHSLGSRFNGKRSGTHFPLTAFSFQAIKHITTIDGGILQVSDPELYEKGKLIRWFGIDKNHNRLQNNIRFQGYKYHMNNVNAAVGLCQLIDVKDVIEKHVSNGRFFDVALSGIPGIELLNYYEGSEPSYWLYTMLVDNREGLVQKLHERGVVASVLHKRSDAHEYLNDFRIELPILNKAYDRLLHIPCGWWVTSEDRERIVEIVRSGW